jgi:hypothetical protein
VQLWGRAEQWIGNELNDFGWGVGASVPLGYADVWAAVRRDTRDPLYWNPSRHSWTVGLTRRLGARPPVFQPAPVSRDGRTILRLPASGLAGPISVAGEFSGWQPRPMQRVGDAWVLELPLAPGVYRYAFVDAAGQWFVPASVPGRLDDGMGGHVAVLIVP